MRWITSAGAKWNWERPEGCCDIKQSRIYANGPGNGAAIERWIGKTLGKRNAWAIATPGRTAADEANNQRHSESDVADLQRRGSP